MFKRQWSKWCDISTGECGDIKYVLQLSRHKNGMVRMRVEFVQNAFGCNKPTLEQIANIKR